MTYPETYGRCIMCGADRGEPCTIISGGVLDDYTPTDDPKWATGAPREYPHANRGPIGHELEPPARFVAVKDEPNHYADEPHTSQCGGPGVCPLTYRPKEA